MMTIVHLTNGDAAAERLREAGLPGEVIVWADPLHEGPVTAATGESWRRQRAAFLASTGAAPEADVLVTLARWDADVERAATAREVVLWFEPDLFDQLLLVRHVSRVESGEWTPGALSLVCRNRHPSLGDVSSLGTISSEAARTLFVEREAIDAAHVDEASRAWAAVCADTPDRLIALVRAGTPALPFLAPALARLLAEYPSVQDGTALTDHFILQAVNPWPLDGIHVFRAVQRFERHAYMGDTTFFWRLWSMATAPHPLVTAAGAQGPDALRFAKIGLTHTGATVSRGLSDAVTLNGLDRWIGGVHLQVKRVPLLLDRSAGALIGRT